MTRFWDSWILKPNHTNDGFLVLIIVFLAVADNIEIAIISYKRGPDKKAVPITIPMISGKSMPMSILSFFLAMKSLVGHPNISCRIKHAIGIDV